ncbi:hypothetical protein [Azospirillum argentinense]
MLCGPVTFKINSQPLEHDFAANAMAASWATRTALMPPDRTGNAENLE